MRWSVAFVVGIDGQHRWILPFHKLLGRCSTWNYSRLYWAVLYSVKSHFRREARHIVALLLRPSWPRSFAFLTGGLAPFAERWGFEVAHSVELNPKLGFWWRLGMVEGLALLVFSRQRPGFQIQSLETIWRWSGVTAFRKAGSPS